MTKYVFSCYLISGCFDKTAMKQPVSVTDKLNNLVNVSQINGMKEADCMT